MRIHLLACLLVAVPSVATQIPPGHVLRATYGPPGPDDMIDPATAKATPITGLSTAAEEINAAAIDPVRGALHLGGIASSAGEIREVRLNGSGVTVERVLANVGSFLSLKAIDHDRNGDLYTCDSNSLYRINRSSGAVTTWDTHANYSGGTFNALCIDAEKNKLWVGTFGETLGGQILEYERPWPRSWSRRATRKDSGPWGGRNDLRPRRRWSRWPLHHHVRSVR